MAEFTATEEEQEGGDNVVVENIEEEEEVKDIDDPSQLHVCPRCKAFFAASGYLKDHMKRKCVRTKNINNPFQCDYCPLSFKQRFQLNRHMMQHTGERPFKCEHCEKTFLTRSHLKRHSVIHIPKDQSEHKCDRCDKVFAWASSLESHIKSHTGEKRFKCGICGRMFLHLNSLRSHMTNRHTVNGKFTCVVCKECFDEPTDLILHMKTHNEQESVKCERCFAFFTSLKDLETHLCTNFGGRPLVCPVCKFEFTKTSDYCNHACMQVNSNRKCGCCLKVLKSLWHLREHLITHTGEKPFKCVHCLNSFRRKRELEIHMTRHNIEKPFSCTQCSQTFTCDNYLRQHTRKEHREKKFICHVCQHAFMHKCALTNHMSFHIRTGNKKYGKKYHRNDGLLVKELVEERLGIKSSVAKNGEILNVCESSNAKGKDGDVELLNHTQRTPPKIGQDTATTDAIDVVMHDDIPSVQDIDNSPDVGGLQDIANCPDVGDISTGPEIRDDFSNRVIEPKIELRNAELDPSNITTIYQTNPNGEVTVRCASCLQDFDSHSALLRHRKEFHNDGKPYQCDLCPKTFSIAANLSQHRGIHNIKRKYSCGQCAKSYKVTHKLREHLRAKHCLNTDELTDLELRLQNSPSDVASTLTGEVINDSEFIGKTLASTETGGTTTVYQIESVSTPNVLITPDNTLSTAVDPSMIQRFNNQNNANSKNVLSNILFLSPNGETSTGITAEQLAKRGDVSFLMNLSTLINDSGDGLGNQRVIIQEGIVSEDS